MSKKQFRTVNGQAISAPLATRAVDTPIGFVDQQLVQILPPIPQRFEWVNDSNIVEVKS
jgi:hypothetical protein